MAVGLCFVSADSELAARVAGGLRARDLEVREWVVDSPAPDAPSNVDGWLTDLDAGVVLWTPALVAHRLGWELAGEAARARRRGRLIHVAADVERLPLMLE